MNGNIYLLIRAQEGMQLFMAKVIHLNFLEGQAYVNSPIKINWQVLLKTGHRGSFALSVILC